MAGKQVRLYLVDGAPGGLLTAEIMNWTGHVVAAPRSDIGELLRREEARRTGIYILVGDDPESPSGSAAYVGEGDDIGARLRQHARSETAGGKDFWDRVIIVTSKDANLTKAHARYLESRLITTAASAGRARLVNSTSPPPIHLPEADVSDMEYFLAQILIVLPVHSVTLFRAPLERSGAVPTPLDAGLRPIHDSPVFSLEIASRGITARAQEVDGEFSVLEGSLASSTWVGTDRHPGYKQLHEKLSATGAIVAAGLSVSTFKQNVVFASPSAAAAVVTGRSANGRTAWVDRVSGVTFGEWQNRGLQDLSDIETTVLA